jgi:HlyD family secretion protein
LAGARIVENAAALLVDGDKVRPVTSLTGAGR